jgi:hypothetical protein
MAINKVNFPVPPYYSDIRNSKVEVNRNILGADMTNWSLNANYLASNGNQKIPMTYIGENVLGSSVLTYRVLDLAKPNINDRYWTLEVSSAYNPGVIQIDINSVYGGATTQIINKSIGINQYLIREQVNQAVSSSYAVDDIQIAFTPYYADPGTPITVYRAFSMFDAPRTFVNPTSQSVEFGVDVVSNKVGKPIFTTPSNHNSSIAGIVQSLNHFSSSAKSGKALWCFYRAFFDGLNLPVYTIYNSMYSTASVANVKTNAFSSIGMMKPIVFATQESTTQVSKSCNVYIYAAVQTVGNTGRFEISSAVGNTSISVTSTSPAWYSSSLLVQTENVLSSSYGGIPQFITNFSGNLDINLTKSTTIDTSYFGVWSVQLMEI